MADNLTIINNAALVKALDAAPTETIATLQRVVSKWQYRRAARLAVYPPALPTSQYRRTGTLGRLWTSAQPTWQASGGGFTSTIGNRTPYASDVQGDKQRPPFRGRWRQARVEAQEAEPELQRDMEQALIDIETTINQAGV